MVDQQKKPLINMIVAKSIFFLFKRTHNYILGQIVQKMHLEYRSDQRKHWNQEDSGAKSTLIDSTFSSMPAKRFQRSNSKNAHNPYHSSSNISDIKVNRPASFKSPSNHQELNSPQIRPTIPTSPTNTINQPNNTSIYSPQYIKIPKSPNNHQLEQKETKNHSVLLGNSNHNNRTHQNIKNLNDWKPTDFKKLSDLNSKKCEENGKQNFLINANKTKSSTNSFFSKLKDNYTYTTNAEKIRKDSECEQNVGNQKENLHEKIAELEYNNQNLQKQMQILKKQKEQMQKSYENYKKQNEYERENLKNSFWMPQHSIKEKVMQKSIHNKSLGEINKNKSLKETALTHQIDQLKEQLGKIKADNGGKHFQSIISDLQEQNSYYKKQLDAVNLRCRVLDQQNRAMGEKWKDSRKLQGQIRYLKASLEDCEEEIKRLKGQNKKLKAVNISHNNFLNPRDSIVGSINMQSETDSLNLSMSWMER